ncbi:hypothetical protein BLS_003816 [Venturia inaequalis]|uniref:L-ornithine N(5)-monooxygenase [NAD(P)H] n=1 Tax=Venturia inaequalis TaxID=5025 RepID=A0A8H3UPD3_VENIN|nr:hypothetical protein BLS_003816 [Venturia inaequalis]
MSTASSNSKATAAASTTSTADSPHDVVCVGFGPAALSLAIALYEQPRPLKVLFIERQPSFSWRGENFPMDRTSMRTNLLQDLVTMRNPLSKFTFLNYLWSTDSLIAYTNLGQMNPPRLVFAKYLAWCASHMDAKGWTRYGQAVKDMEPMTKSNDDVELWKINVQDEKTGEAANPVFAKKVILALGEQPKLPRALSGFQFNDRVLHSVDFMKTLPKLREWKGPSLNIAVVGGNDEAVEILEQCESYLDTAKVTLFLSDAALRQTDENPFIGTLTAKSKGRNPGGDSTTVQREALASLYTSQYESRIRAERAGKEHLLDIQSSTDVLGVEQANDKIVLKLLDKAATGHSQPFDFVFLASGYERGLQEDLVAPAKHLLDSRDGTISVDKDYKVMFRRGSMASELGVWIMDAFSKGGDDTFPSVALRSGMVAKSLLIASQPPKQERKVTQEPTERAVL